MSRKIIFSLSLIILLSPHSFLFANLKINEIMYDLKTGSDDGREWIEIYNDADAPADFSSYKFFEGNTNHKLILFQGDAKIGARGFAIIVSDPTRFKIDYPNFGGIIFDSSFSLSNSGEILAIKDDDVVVDEYFYSSSTGGVGDGKSLQKVNGVWISANPTAGNENKFTPPVVSSTLPPKSQTSANSQAKSEESENVKNLQNIPEIMPTEKLPYELAAKEGSEGKNSPLIFASSLFILIFSASGA